MNLIKSAIQQPVTVAVGVILILLAGVISLRRIPIQLTPNVEDTIVAVTTRWEGASPEEIEQEVVDPQEEKLQGIANLKEMTSASVQGQGTVRLEFTVGTSKEQALREVSDKLREVPEYPNNTDEPIIEASDPDNRDYIAWIIFESSDSSFDIRTLQDFAEDRIKPNFERVPGVSEINVLGGRERETQVRFDAVRLAERGISVSQFLDALRRSNLNVSAGEVPEDKRDVRLRLVNQFDDPLRVEQTVVAQTEAGPVRVRDVASVVETYKEPTSFVRSSGNPVIAINAQKEVGVNVMEVMKGLQGAIDEMNRPDGLLQAESRQLALDGVLSLRQVYDQTVYIDDALQLVEDNIVYGGLLAILVLLLFLRSVKSSGIIALAIPISIVGAVAAMISIGRTVNVISLAGMAFAIGMVVDNAIVVLENIYRHLEMGKNPMQAAFDGTREVFGAVVAATLTTVVVFIPILMIQDEAGQLFRDISLAIVASVLLSLLVSVTVIPVCAGRLLKQQQVKPADAKPRGIPFFRSIPDWIGRFTYWTGGSVLARLAIVVALTAISVYGTKKLLPPSDYLPLGNRNLVFGILMPPPGYNMDQSISLAKRIETTIEPFWKAGKLERGSPEYQAAEGELPQVPTFDMATMSPGDPVVPPPLVNYFIVSFPGFMFHGGITSEPDRVVDLLPLFAHATRAEQAPGVLAFAQQVPLFRIGGRSGSAVKVNLSGDDLDQVSNSALAVFMQLMSPENFGPGTIQPDPANFNLPGPELRVVPDLVRLSEVGMTPRELGDAVWALGDGAIIGDYRVGGETIDLKVLSDESLDRPNLATIGETPIATPLGGVVPLASLGELQRVNSPPQINRLNRRRSVTLQVTPPPGMPVEEAISKIESILEQNRANGTIPSSVLTTYTGTASKLASVQEAMFGDGSFAGTVGSAMMLALIVVYLLMCALFQSFLRPLVIMFSVPLATLGGFAALYGVHVWSLWDPYLPVQNLDILTMLGFVILIGVVVNNAILIVHQARNFMLGEDGEPMPPRRAIAEAVRTRVRPIFMGSLTSVGGMTPLVFMPGSGSELYRGLGSVVVGGLIVSTIFTLLLVPALFGLLTQLQEKLNMLSETKQLEAKRSSAASAAAGLAILALAFLPGCLGAEPEPRRRSSAVLHDVVSRQLEELSSDQDQRQELEQRPTRVEDVLGDRIEELEAEGGQESLDDLELDLPTPLDGGSERTREVDLYWVVNAATTNNLAVQFSQEQVQVDREGYKIAAAQFDPSLFSDLEVGTNDEPTIVPNIGGIPLGTGESVEDRAVLRAGVRQLIESGATIEASTGLRWADDRTSGITFSPDPSYRSDLALVVTQPLLAGRGADVTTAERQLRRNQYERSEQVLRQDLSVVMQATESAYWDLVEAWKVLAIQQQLTDRGAEVERVLGERRAFDAKPAEYSDALATLESRRADLVRAQRIVGIASDRLKQLINDPELPIYDDQLLVPSEALVADAFDYDLRRLMLTAVSQRPEVQSAVLSIDDSEIRQRVADNLKDAQLDLRLGASVIGQDGDAGGSYDQMFGDDHYVLFAGLSFELPVGNRAGRARDRQAMRENRQAILAYEQVVRDVMLEVKEALRDVRTNFELVAATRAFRLAQTENLRSLAAERESRSELSPEFLNLVFQRQEGLARAQLGEVQALTDYKRSVAALYRALGGGMGADRIDISRP